MDLGLDSLDRSKTVAKVQDMVDGLLDSLTKLPFSFHFSAASKRNRALRKFFDFVAENDADHSSPSDAESPSITTAQAALVLGGDFVNCDDESGAIQFVSEEQPRMRIGLVQFCGTLNESKQPGDRQTLTALSIDTMELLGKIFDDSNRSGQNDAALYMRESNLEEVSPATVLRMTFCMLPMEVLTEMKLHLHVCGGRSRKAAFQMIDMLLRSRKSDEFSFVRRDATPTSSDFLDELLPNDEAYDLYIEWEDEDRHSANNVEYNPKEWSKVKLDQSFETPWTKVADEVYRTRKQTRNDASFNVRHELKRYNQTLGNLHVTPDPLGVEMGNIAALDIDWSRYLELERVDVSKNTDTVSLGSSSFKKTLRANRGDYRSYVSSSHDTGDQVSERDSVAEMSIHSKRKRRAFFRFTRAGRRFFLNSNEKSPIPANLNLDNLDLLQIEERKEPVYSFKDKDENAALQSIFAASVERFEQRAAKTADGKPTKFKLYPSIRFGSVDFDPSLFLFRVHRKTPTGLLQDGLKKLENDTVDEDARMKSLILQNFEEFVYCRKTIGRIEAVLQGSKNYSNLSDFLDFGSISLGIRKSKSKIRKESDKNTRKINIDRLQDTLQTAVQSSKEHFGPLIQKEEEINKLQRAIDYLSKIKRNAQTSHGASELATASQWVDATVEIIESVPKVLRLQKLYESSISNNGFGVAKLYSDASTNLENRSIELIHSLQSMMMASFPVDWSSREASGFRWRPPVFFEELLTPAEALSLLLELNRYLPVNSKVHKILLNNKWLAKIDESFSGDPLMQFCFLQSHNCKEALRLIHHCVEANIAAVEDMLERATCVVRSYLYMWKESEVCLDVFDSGRSGRYFSELTKRHEGDIATLLSASGNIIESMNEEFCSTKKHTKPLTWGKSFPLYKDVDYPFIFKSRTFTANRSDINPVRDQVLKWRDSREQMASCIFTEYLSLCSVILQACREHTRHISAADFASYHCHCKSTEDLCLPITCLGLVVDSFSGLNARDALLAALVVNGSSKEGELTNSVEIHAANKNERVDMTFFFEQEATQCLHQVFNELEAQIQRYVKNEIENSQSSVQNLRHVPQLRLRVATTQAPFCKCVYLVTSQIGSVFDNVLSLFEPISVDIFWRKEFLSDLDNLCKNAIQKCLNYLFEWFEAVTCTGLEIDHILNMYADCQYLVNDFLKEVHLRSTLLNKANNAGNRQDARVRFQAVIERIDKINGLLLDSYVDKWGQKIQAIISGGIKFEDHMLWANVSLGTRSYVIDVLLNLGDSISSGVVSFQLEEMRRICRGICTVIAESWLSGLRKISIEKLVSKAVYQLWSEIYFLEFVLDDFTTESGRNCFGVAEKLLEDNGKLGTLHDVENVVDGMADVIEATPVYQNFRLLLASLEE